MNRVRLAGYLILLCCPEVTEAQLAGFPVDTVESLSYDGQLHPDESESSGTWNLHGFGTSSSWNPYAFSQTSGSRNAEPWPSPWQQYPYGKPVYWDGFTLVAEPTWIPEEPTKYKISIEFGIITLTMATIFYVYQAHQLNLTPKDMEDCTKMNLLQTVTGYYKFQIPWMETNHKKGKLTLIKTPSWIDKGSGSMKRSRSSEVKKK